VAKGALGKRYCYEEYILGLILSMLTALMRAADKMRERVWGKRLSVCNGAVNAHHNLKELKLAL
jgi:hypothetical protein